MKDFRVYGDGPYDVAVVHGGPGIPGAMAPVARELAADRGVLEPLQSAGTIDGHRKTIFGLAPGNSSLEQGVHFYVYIERLADYLGMKREQLDPLFPGDAKDSIPWTGADVQIEGFFKTTDEVARLVDGLRELRT